MTNDQVALIAAAILVQGWGPVSASNNPKGVIRNAEIFARWLDNPRTEQ